MVSKNKPNKLSTSIWRWRLPIKKPNSMNENGQDRSWLRAWDIEKASSNQWHSQQVVCHWKTRSFREQRRHCYCMNTCVRNNGEVNTFRREKSQTSCVHIICIEHLIYKFSLLFRNCCSATRLDFSGWGWRLQRRFSWMNLCRLGAFDSWCVGCGYF